MTVIATASNPLFGVSRIEVDRGRPDVRRGHPPGAQGRPGRGSVLRHRRGRDPRDRAVEGQEDLFELAHFIAATRPGYDMAGFEVPEIARDAVTMMNIPALAISSTDIRDRVSRRPIHYLVPGGREELHREVGAVPVTAATRVHRRWRCGVAEPRRGSRPWSWGRSPRTARRGSATPAERDPVVPTTSGTAARPSELLVLQVEGTDDPLLASSGRARGIDRPRSSASRSSCCSRCPGRARPRRGRSRAWTPPRSGWRSPTRSAPGRPTSRRWTSRAWRGSVDRAGGLRVRVPGVYVTEAGTWVPGPRSSLGSRSRRSWRCRRTAPSSLVVRRPGAAATTPSARWRRTSPRRTA